MPKKALFLLPFVFIILALSACSSQQREYLDAMEDWHNSWGPTSGYFEGPALLELLRNISPPADMWYEHQLYVTAHATRVLAWRHVGTAISDYNFNHDTDEGDCEIPSGANVIEACALSSASYQILEGVRRSWEDRYFNE